MSLLSYCHSYILHALTGRNLADYSRYSKREKVEELISKPSLWKKMGCLNKKLKWSTAVQRLWRNSYGLLNIMPTARPTASLVPPPPYCLCNQAKLYPVATVCFSAEEDSKKVEIDLENILLDRWCALSVVSPRKVRTVFKMPFWADFALKHNFVYTIDRRLN